MDYITVGKLNKTFGTKGQIRVVADKAFKSDLEECDVWFVEKSGSVVPYFVESLEESVHFLVKFEDIDGPEAARSITGCTLKLRKKDVNYQNAEEVNELDKLVGFSIQSKDGMQIGVIDTIEEYPQQLMAIVFDKSNNQLLIPLASEFMVDMNVEESIIIMELPDGLIQSQLG